MYVGGRPTFFTFLRFFQISKNMIFTFFELLHTFSRTLVGVVDSRVASNSGVSVVWKPAIVNLAYIVHCRPTRWINFSRAHATRRSEDRGFDSRPFSLQATTLGKLFTHTCAYVNLQYDVLPVEMYCNVMSMWSLRRHFTNKSVTRAPYSIKSVSLSHSRTLWWRVRWLKQCRLQIAAELQQRWHRTKRRRKTIPRSSSSHREDSIIQRGASCGRYDQRRRRSTPKTPTRPYVGSQVEGLSKVWRRRADKATIRENT